MRFYLDTSQTLLSQKIWSSLARSLRINSAIEMFELYIYNLCSPMGLSVKGKERAEEDWGGGGESPSGRIQKGKRQHGKGSRKTWRTWPTAKSSLADLGWHSTSLRQPHKLFLVKAYRALCWNKLPPPHACKQCTQIKIGCRQTWQCSYKTNMHTHLY